MNGSMLLDRWRQRVLPWGHIGAHGEYDWICASFGPFESKTQTANQSVKPFLHRWMPIIYSEHPHPPELPSNGGSGVPCKTWCCGPMRVHNANGNSIGSAVFAQMTAECPYTLQWFAFFPLKIAPSHVDIWTWCNTWFNGPTRVLNPNGNLIVSAIFAGLTSVTHWQTDRPRYSVRCGIIMHRVICDTAKPHTRFMSVRTISPLLSWYLYV